MVTDSDVVGAGNPVVTGTRRMTDSDVVGAGNPVVLIADRTDEDRFGLFYVNITGPDPRVENVFRASVSEDKRRKDAEQGFYYVEDEFYSDIDQFARACRTRWPSAVIDDRRSEDRRAQWFAGVEAEYYRRMESGQKEQEWGDDLLYGSIRLRESARRNVFEEQERIRVFTYTVPKEEPLTLAASPDEWAADLFRAVGPTRHDAVFRALSKVLHPDVETGDKVLMDQLLKAREILA